MLMLIMLDWKPSINNQTIFDFFLPKNSLNFRLEQTRAELIDERVKSTDEKITTNAELSSLRTRYLHIYILAIKIKILSFFS